MPLSDIFNKLKTSIVGTSTLGIDTKLDNAVKDITAYRSQIGRNGYIELVKNLIAKTGLEVPMSLSQSTMITPAALGQGTRLMRYRTYDGIISNINYTHRAITVLTDNILAPDDITKTTLEVTPATFLEGEKNVSSDVRNCKDLIKKLKIENALDIIIKNTLTYGDFFAEIADAKTALTSRSAILTEVYDKNLNDKDLDSFIVEGEDNKKLKIILDYSSFEDENVEKNKKHNEKSKIELPDVHILYYEPKRVVKLQSDMFPVCFGYLVFPQAVINPNLTIQNQMVNSICQNILSSLAQKIPNLNQDTINTTDLKDIIYTMAKESDPSRAMSIRYVSPKRMQHFMIPTTKYYPYGESMLDSTVFTAKLITALETALVIFRLNRSTEKRKISIEVGLPRDARKAIEKIKEEFRKRKISIDSLGTVDTIPGMINTFEDIYLPAKDGKNFVDVTTFSEGLVDTRGKVDEIKTLRDQLVASLGVPASFLGIEENMNAKCISLDSKIKLLNGDHISLTELIDEYDKTGEIKNKYTYSYDHESGKIVCGKITWAGKTRRNAKVVKVTLDNGESEIVTPDHNFMLRDGTYIQAQYLKKDDSLMPLYTKITNSYTTTNKIPYSMVYHPGIDSWELVHRMVAKEKYIVKDGDGMNIHHINFNPMDNTSEMRDNLSKARRKGGLIISGQKLEEYLKLNGSWNKGLTTTETDERVRLNGEHCKGSHLNHKVVSVEFLSDVIDTGDITVEKYHNFSLSSGIIVHNSTLAEENVMFARTIVNHQKYLTQQIRDLIQKLYEILDPEKALSILDNVTISLPPPKSLQFEREAKYMSDLVNLVQALEGIGVPKAWAKKKYLTNIDWEEVKKFEIDTKIDKGLGIKKRSDAGMQTGEEPGGMGMGGFPPTGDMGY